MWFQHLFMGWECKMEFKRMRQTTGSQWNWEIHIWNMEVGISAAKEFQLVSLYPWVYFWNIAISFSNIKLLYPCKYIIFVPQNVLKNTYPFCIHVLLTKQIWRQYQPMGCFWSPGNIIIKLSYITFQLWWWSCITVLKYSCCCCCHPKRFSLM